MLSYNDLRPGVVFVLAGRPHKVLEYEFIRMQQRKPVAQLKLKDLTTGKVLQYTAHQNESFEEADIKIMTLLFLYAHRSEYWFCELGNPKNRISLKGEVLGNTVGYLKPQAEVKALVFNDAIITVELPIKMEFQVAEAPPGIRGDTAQGGSKTVKLETGAEIQAPLFINVGDVIRVNTETGEYVERVEKLARE